MENKRVAGASGESKKHKDSNKLLSSFGCKECHIILGVGVSYGKPNSKK